VTSPGESSPPSVLRRPRVRRAAIALTAVAVVVTLAALAVVATRSNRRRATIGAEPKTSTSIGTNRPSAVSTTAPKTIPPPTVPPPASSLPTASRTTCCIAGAVPTTVTISGPAVPPVAQRQDFTGSLAIGTQGQAAPVVERVGGELQIGVLVRNGSDHPFVVGDPTGQGYAVNVALVCSHLGGLANWSLPIVDAGTRWIPGDNTGIISHEVVQPSDIGRQTCQVAFVRGGSAPRFDPISHAMISHDVTILASLPNLHAVALIVDPLPAQSTSTASDTTTVPAR